MEDIERDEYSAVTNDPQDDVPYSKSLLKELHFEQIYLFPEQESRLEEVILASMKYERNAFIDYYNFHRPIEEIAAREHRNITQIMIWISKIAANIDKMREYILTGKY